MTFKDKIKHSLINVFIISCIIISGPISLLPLIIFKTFVLIVVTLLIPFRIRRAKIILTNISNIHPNYSKWQKFVLVFKILNNLSIFITEYVKSLNPLSKIREKSVNKDCCEKIDYVAKKYKDSPCFIFTIHIANWEILSKFFHNLDNNFVVTGKPQKHFWSSVKKNRGTDVIGKGKDMIKSIISNIKDKKHICSMFDQKQKNGFNLNFMGHICSTPNVLPKLALKYKVPMLLMYSFRDKNGKYSISSKDISDEINYEDQSEENLKNICQEINNHFSDAVFKYSDQWFCWLHKRWEFNYDKI